MTSSLVGSEMCIRDSAWKGNGHTRARSAILPPQTPRQPGGSGAACRIDCLLYTSDAADDM
eukprot:12463425-Prorocentrum_lima.AAC.1